VGARSAAVVGADTIRDGTFVNVQSVGRFSVEAGNRASDLQVQVSNLVEFEHPMDTAGVAIGVLLQVTEGVEDCVLLVIFGVDERSHGGSGESLEHALIYLDK